MLSLFSFQRPSIPFYFGKGFSSRRSSHLRLQEAGIHAPFSSYRAHKAIPMVPACLRLRGRCTL